MCAPIHGGFADRCGRGPKRSSRELIFQEAGSCPGRSYARAGAGCHVDRLDGDLQTVPHAGCHPGPVFLDSRRLPGRCVPQFMAGSPADVDVDRRGVVGSLSSWTTAGCPEDVCPNSWRVRYSRMPANRFLCIIQEERPALQPWFESFGQQSGTIQFSKRKAVAV